MSNFFESPLLTVVVVLGMHNVAMLLQGTATASTCSGIVVTLMVIMPRSVGTVIAACARLAKFGFTVKVANEGPVCASPITPHVTPAIALAPHSCE